MCVRVKRGLGEVLVSFSAHHARVGDALCVCVGVSVVVEREIVCAGRGEKNGVNRGGRIGCAGRGGEGLPVQGGWRGGGQVFGWDGCDWAAVRCATGMA